MCFAYGDNKNFKNTIVGAEEFYVNQAAGAYPLSQFPVFQIDDGNFVCQSGAIASYAARINGLYPKDELKALYVDEIYEVVESCFNNSAIYLMAEGEGKEAARQAFLKRDLVRFENFMKLRVSDSPFIANNEFSVADIALYFFIHKHLIFRLVGFTLEQLSEVIPTGIAFVEKLMEQPVFKTLLEKCQK